MSASITFETKVWEGDWDFILRPARMHRVIGRNGCSFDQRIVYINNVASPGRVIDRAKRLIADGVITRVEIVEEHLDSALEAYGLTRASLGIGLVYSSAELVGLHRCPTRYLLHFAGDAMVTSTVAWPALAMRRMDADPRFLTMNPVWDFKRSEAKRESIEEDPELFVGYGFSDQCYLLRPADLVGADFGRTHPSDSRYPSYGGDSFEKRVNSWMRSERLLRGTIKTANYVSRNWPRRGFPRFIVGLGERLGMQTERWRRPSILNALRGGLTRR